MSFKISCILLVVALGVTSVFAAVTNINARFYKGKTYLTFTEEAGSDITYNVYRSSSAIASVSGLQPIATIAQGSGYDTRYSWYHVITNQGTPLASGTGLFVYTPHDTANAWYAVTTVSGGVENTTIISGSNALSASVGEQYWQWPGAILRYISGTDYIYCYWMDYADWNHTMDYYGDLFGIGDGGNFRTSGHAPISVYLHGVNNTQAHVPPNPGALSTELQLVLYDFALRANSGTTRPANNWWFGVSKRYLEGGQLTHANDTIVNYTQMRILNYVNSMRSDSLFGIDTNRIYLAGGSMGGCGTINGSLHHPGLWAASWAMVPVVNMDFYYGFDNPYPNSYFQNIYGRKTDNCRVRNGATIYQWVDPNWICRQAVSTDMPPMLMSHTSDDGPRSMRMYRAFYNTCNATKHALFGNWQTGGHIEVATQMPGGYLRFRKNELYPAFSNCTTVDNYGQLDPDTSNAPINPDYETLTFDAVGQYNTFLDWTSSLHDLGLSNDDLIDSPDSVALTLVSSRPNTAADITLRRIQQLRIDPAAEYLWKATAVSNGTEAGSGSVALDSDGLLTIPQVPILVSGTRLIVAIDSLHTDADSKKTNTQLTEKALDVAFPGLSGLLALVLPATMDVTVSIFDVRGALVKTVAFPSLAQGEHRIPITSLHTGMYLCRIKAGKTRLVSKMAVVR